MKRKLLTRIFVLVSAVFCVICISACKNREESAVEGSVGNEAPVHDDYIGKYNFVLGRVAVTADGNETVSYLVAGENGVTADYYQLELRDDDRFVLEMSIEGIVVTRLKGEWTLRGDKIRFTGRDGFTGSFEDATFDSGILTVVSIIEAGKTITEQTIRLKKVD